MREIKFRAWDKTTNQMAKITRIDFTDVQYTAVNYQYKNSKGRILDDLSLLSETGHGTIVLMQYTGLKDKNGKEVYEGDVVKTHDQNNVIKYQHGSFMLIGLHEDRYERNYSRLYHYLIDSTIPNMEGSRFDGVTTTLEIVGNIYEHPHLLEESK